MKFKLSDLWRWEGTIDRGPYAFVGVIGFAIKHNIDRFVATVVFHRQWGLFNYWIPPTKAVRITALSRQDAELLGTLLALALPFIWVGIALTMRRLRAVGLPAWLVVVFFLPVINLAFFALLSVLPSRPATGSSELAHGGWFKGFLDRMIPESPLGSAAMAVLLTVAFGAAVTALGTKGFAKYGWGLFVALPFCLGLGSALLYGYHRPRGYVSCLVVSILSTILLGVALAALAIEGVFCLAMALPIALMLTCMGGSIGYLIQARPWSKTEAPATLLVLILFVPAMMGAEYVSPSEPPRIEVRTAIDIDAPPEEVWRHLVSFADLPKPKDWLFRLGVAYPIRATIQGRGVGAVRQCLFSTGTFVEPVGAWQEARLLEFSVSSQPPPMRELTPYAEIHPRHLSSYLHPGEAQFLLVPLPGGRTRLQGTSWYRNEMWPSSYWQIWSDLIVHRIHLRVFKHIKHLAEQHRPSRAAR